MKRPKILNKLKTLIVGKMPIDINVSDIAIAQVLLTKDTHIKSNQLKNKIIKNFVGNKISLLINAKDAPKYVFQDILYQFHKKNKRTFLIIGGYIDIKLTQEDIEIFKSQNKTPPPTKKILRIFFGSTHKPFDEDFHNKLDIPCDFHNIPIISKTVSTKINEIFNYFNLFCDNTKVISQNIQTDTKNKNFEHKPLLYFITDKQDVTMSSRELQKNINLVSEEDIRAIFNNLTVFERVNKKQSLTLILSAVSLVVIYQVFMYLNIDKVDVSSQNDTKIKRIITQISILKRKSFELEDTFEHKKKMIETEMKIYKGK